MLSEEISSSVYKMIPQFYCTSLEVPDYVLLFFLLPLREMNKQLHVGFEPTVAVTPQLNILMDESAKVSDWRSQSRSLRRKGNIDDNVDSG